MERLPAAILVFTACLTCSVAAFVNHDGQGALVILGIAVGAIGLYAWFTTHPK